MRRRRHHGRIGGFCRHPVDAGKMKAADAAGLMAARTGHVVEPPLKAGDRADVLQLDAVARRPSSMPRRLALAEHGVGRRSSPCTRPNAGCRFDGANPTGVGAIAPLARNFSGIRMVPRSSSARCLGSSSHALNSRLRPSSARIRSRSIWFSSGASSNVARLRVVAKHLQQIVGAEIAHRRFRRMRDLQIGFDAVDVFGLDQIERTVLGQSTCPQAPRRSAADSPAASHRCAMSAQVIGLPLRSIA